MMNRDFVFFKVRMINFRMTSVTLHIVCEDNVEFLLALIAHQDRATVS